MPEVMSRQDAARVLAIITSAFPGHEFTEDNATIWYQAVLKDITFEVGVELARKLVTDPDRQSPHSFPKLSEFQALRRARARAIDSPPRQLEAKTDPVTARENIAKLRATLDAAPINKVRDL